jgi:hypothetical protein
MTDATAVPALLARMGATGPPALAEALVRQANPDQRRHLLALALEVLLALQDPPAPPARHRRGSHARTGTP